MLDARVILSCLSSRMTSLSSCGLGCGTCAWERSGGSGLPCGAETSDQTGTCSCAPLRVSVCEEESGGEVRATSGPGEIWTCPPSFSWAGICLPWAVTSTSSSAGSVTSALAGSVSEAGSSAQGQGPQ